jgi:hypothetical protein
MDIILSVQSIISFVSFFVLQIVIFRRIRDREVMKWLVYVYLIISVCHFVEAMLYWKIIQNNIEKIPIILGYACISFAIYSLIVVSYVNAIFGIAITSLRIQILTEIMSFAHKGISGKTIAKKYSREVIIKKRLERLMASGEIKFSGGFYRPKIKMSFFIMHTYFLIFINRLYHKPVYQFSEK